MENSALTDKQGCLPLWLDHVTLVMPLPMEWARALLDESTILVVSDTIVRNRVNAEQARLQAAYAAASKPVPTWKQLSSVIPAPIESSIRPITLLHAIGRATTPPVANMSDISSTWAIIRYVWALSRFNRGNSINAFLATLNPPLSNPVGPTYLGLSDAARDIDFHQKTLMSDEMGVGLAWVVMERLFGVSDGIDFSRALATMNVNVNGRRTPDYVFRGAPNQAIIVECKGTRTSLSETVDQLLSGSEQVASCLFPPHIAVQRIVCATRFCAEHIVVYVYDPELPSSDGEDTLELHWRGKKKMLSQEISARLFFDIEARQAFSKKLTFCGLHSEARKVADSRSRLDNVAKPVLRTIGRGDYIGAYETVISVDGDVIKVFKGLNTKEYYRGQSDLGVYLEDVRVLAKEAPAVRRRRREVRWETDDNVTTFQSEEAIEVRSVASDGTILTIEIERQ